MLNSVSVFYSVALYLMTPESKTKKRVKIGEKGKGRWWCHKIWSVEGRGGVGWGVGFST